MAARRACAVLVWGCLLVDAEHAPSSCSSDDCVVEEQSLLQSARQELEPSVRKTEKSAPSRNVCMCTENFPKCHSDGWCYNGWVWHWTHCAGHCNADYGSSPNPPPCSFRTWKAEDAATQMVLGTRQNMDSRLFDAGIDFSGLWWMRHNPVPEVLASFAGVKVNSSSFPLKMIVPNNLKNQWSWQDNTAGDMLMAFYSQSKPDAPMEIIMQDAANGGIQTALSDFPGIYVEAWGFHKFNGDQWNRPTSFQDKSLVGRAFGDSNYTLTRIVREDGTKTQYWSDFLASKDAVQQLSFGNDNFCMRTCETAGTCYLCQKLCSNQ